MGGLFIPLVTQGAVLGSLVHHIEPASNPALFRPSASPPSSAPALDERGDVVGVVTQRDLANVEILLDRLTADSS